MIKLYNYWRSSCSWRVRIALNLKGLEYQYIPVNLLEKPRNAELQALNPQGYVPCLVDGDLALGQSIAILAYLESTYPQPALLPANIKLRARSWAFCMTIAGDTQPFQNISTLGYLTDHFGASEAQKSAWLRHWIEKGMRAAEALLPSQDFQCSFGDTPSFADCCLVPQMYSMKRFGADVSVVPRLAAIAARLERMPAFAAAHADRQPDAPKPA